MNEWISLICESHFCVHPIGHKTTFHKKSNGQTFSRLYKMCHVNQDTSSCPFYHKHINTSNNQSICLKSQFYIFFLKFPKKTNFNAFSNFSIFFSKIELCIWSLPRILNQDLWGANCITSICVLQESSLDWT